MIYKLNSKQNWGKTLYEIKFSLKLMILFLCIKKFVGYCDVFCVHHAFKNKKKLTVVFVQIEHY